MRAPTFDKVGDVFPDERDTLTVRVSSNGANLSLELLGTSDDICREDVLCQLSKCRPFHQRRYLCRTLQVDQPAHRASKTTHLSDECNRWLIKPHLLRVPNVRRDDLVERQAVIVFRLELYAVLLCPNGQLATHGILDVEKGGIQGIDRECTHAFFVAASEL